MHFSAGFTEGLIEDMPDEQYHALPYCSNSFCTSLFNLYPEEAQYNRNNPEESTKSQLFGQAAHYVILQPELFEKKYLIAPKCQAMVASTGKPCEKDCTMLTADGQWLCGTHGKKAVRDPVQPKFIGKDDYEKCLKIRDKIAADPRATALFGAGGLKEVTMLFIDPVTGMKCKARLDHVLLEHGIINDVKTSRDVKEFGKSFYDWGYHRQQAFYKFGGSVLYQKGLIKKPFDHFNFIAADKTPPHIIGVFSTPDDQYELGMQQLRPLMDLCHRCESSGIWPGHGYDWQEGRAVIQDIRISPFKAAEIQKQSFLGDLSNV